MYEKLRQEMVRQQLIRRGISDSRVLEAMGRVERHLFVSEDLQQQAYNDCALPVGGETDYFSALYGGANDAVT